MLSKISTILIYVGISASFFAWGNIWGTAILATYALGNLLPGESWEVSGNMRLKFLIILEFCLMILVAIIGAFAIGFAAPGEIYGIPLGVLFCIAVLAIHVFYIVHPE